MAFTTPNGQAIDTPYSGEGFSTAYDTLYKQIQSLSSDSGQNQQILVNRLNQAGDQFKNLFQNSVGRAPSQDELNQFFKENAGQTISNSAQGWGQSEKDPTGVRNNIQQYIGDTFQQQAKDYATNQLTNQQSQAASLGDLFRTQGKQAISDTQSMLQEYAQNLFQKLQPQLLTSMQSMGLLNSGALNEAEAGAQKDLAAGTQGFLANANLNMENQANAITFGGAAAPYLYQQGQIQNQVPYLQSMGAGALDMNNKTFMSNLDFAHQMALLQEQDAAKSSLQNNSFGFGNNFSQSFGSSFGSGLGKLGDPNTYSGSSSSSSGPGGSSMAKSGLFA